MISAFFTLIGLGSTLFCVVVAGQQLYRKGLSQLVDLVWADIDDTLVNKKPTVDQVSTSLRRAIDNALVNAKPPQLGQLAWTLEEVDQAN